MPDVDDALGAILDVGEDKPEQTETVPEVTPEPETTPAEVQETATEQTGVEPLLGRLRTAGATENDLEQVQRYYGRETRNAELEAQVSEFGTGKDTNKARADELMAQVSPELQAEHAAYRKKFTDATYVVSREAALEREKADAPAETETEQLLRLVKAQGQEIKAIRQEREESANLTRFDTALTTILDGGKHSQPMRDFLWDDVHATVTEGVADAKQLAAFVQKRVAALSGLIASEGTTTKKPTPLVETKRPTPSGEPGPEKELTIDGLFDRVEKELMSGSEDGMGSG